MRFAWTLRTDVSDVEDATGLAAEAAAAERHGFDAVWIAYDGLAPAGAAAFLASATTSVRIGITVPLGDDHPVEVAEQVAVADLAVGGRLVLAVRPAPGAEDDFAEAVDLVLLALSSHPFRHEGPRWPTPANLGANRFHVESRVRVTPAPAQFELPVWVTGAAGRPVAIERGLGVIVDSDEDRGDVAEWLARTSAESVASRRARRSVIWEPPRAGDQLDAERAVTTLHRWQRDLDVDLAIVDTGPVEPGERVATMAAVMRHVRPRVQLDRLPPGLVDHWASHEQQQGASDA
jgi:alkanesulfonate monooxygenase SsuD/methylene tetrahydromethanopterin reductase-like flavin-dependent oxidoreductase (luciferase family)